MKIDIPPSLSHHEPHLRAFFEAMVFKLHVNSYKDETAEKDVPILIDLGLKELQEFKDELVVGEGGELSFDQIGPNSLIELADQANFQYLLFWFLRKRGVPDSRELFIRHFFRVDTNAGKIYAAASRSGSRYREGDEIAGTERGGRIYIRTQHAVSGASVSLPRCEIIWWSAHGEWPDGEIRHNDGDTTNDAISNLMVVTTRSTRSFPFVTQWKPRGREGSDNYGKWVYQRRHNLILIKCGYYDTPEEAAEQGLKAWKGKTRCLNENTAT